MIKKVDQNGNITNETDYNKIFMGAAMAVVFVMQGYQQNIQNTHAARLESIDQKTLSADEIDDVIDTRTNEILSKILKIEKRIEHNTENRTNPE